MLDFDAICRGRTRFWKPLLVFDAWFWCYLSWPEALLDFIVCLRCLILMLFVVFQSTWLFYCLPSMLDFDAICGVPEHLTILLFAFDAWSWWYLSWPEELLEVIAFLRCLILTLFVVAGHTFGGHCFSSMLDLDAIWRARHTFGGHCFGEHVFKVSEFSSLRASTTGHAYGSTKHVFKVSKFSSLRASKTGHAYGSIRVI